MTVSRAFVKENEDQESYLEWQKLLRDREELLRILEKKKKYLQDDPAAAKIPEKKRKEMAAKSRPSRRGTQAAGRMLEETRTP